MTTDLFCPKCGKETDSPNKTQYQHDMKRAATVIDRLLKEFKNPDNHSHQRTAIEEAEAFLKVLAS